ncbi:MAG: helix-turn-helix domain-containing protein [Candidatus Doudnabacteria bacterium]|nr:helix-turn-helix domain-containing protein [Candidatus Doudnabacteria bacterium]
MDNSQQTVSINKACELTGVSRRTIYNWISAGKLKYIRTAGGSIRIFSESLWRNADFKKTTETTVSRRE